MGGDAAMGTISSSRINPPMTDFDLDFLERMQNVCKWSCRLSNRLVEGLG